MVQWYQMCRSIDCERNALPFVDLLQESIRYIYLYDPRSGTHGYRVAAWRQVATSMYRRFAFDTGAVMPNFPTSYHAEVEKRMRATGRGQSEVVAEIVEEMWPELKRQIEATFAARGPHRNEDVAVSAAEFDHLLMQAAGNGLFDALPRSPEAFDEPAARIIARATNREIDLLTSYASTTTGIGRFVTVAWRLAGFDETE